MSDNKIRVSSVTTCIMCLTFGFLVGTFNTYLRSLPDQLASEHSESIDKKAETEVVGSRSLTASSSLTDSQPLYYPVTVTYIVDGDTIDVSIPIWTDVTLQKRLRFDTLDTWELRGEDKEKGLAAKAFLTDLLSKGPVYIKTDGSTGKYGRTLASIYVKDGETIVDVQEVMRQNGHAKVVQ